MKSKSFDLVQTSVSKVSENNHDQRFDFVNLYKTATKTNHSLVDVRSCGDHTDQGTPESSQLKRLKSKQKEDKREPVDVPLITIDGDTLGRSKGGRGSSPPGHSLTTSTPHSDRKLSNKTSLMESIMKHSEEAVNETVNDAVLDYTYYNSKKRNKSVSFLIEDIEEVTKKKSKSDDSEENASLPKVKANKIKREYKNTKKDIRSEKENNLGNHKQNVNMIDKEVHEKKKKLAKFKADKLKHADRPLIEPMDKNQSSHSETTNFNRKEKKTKKVKKLEKHSTSEDNTASIQQEETSLEKIKKPKKKKQHLKHQLEVDSEEPASKNHKKDNPDITENLEHLSIGDNAHTLTNLIDDMTVADKTKSKKLKQKAKKIKKETLTKEIAKTDDDGVEKEKKWKKRKWNKDNKADVKEENLDTTVVVENLPLSLLFSYKKVLTEHFEKYGLVKSISIPEVYATDKAQPRFATTVTFYSDGAAEQALQKHNSVLEGNKIQVKRALPATETTVVLRSYGALTAHAASAALCRAGHIRNIRTLIKGKHAMMTVFIEFDGPESVERAMKIGANIKIGGKKIYLSKFEIRKRKSKEDKANNNDGSDADHSDNSRD